jgi:hypothetical protein
MAPLIVMNEPLVTRVVNDLVAQCRVPSFGPRRAPPVRLAETNEAIEKRSDPQRARTGSGQKIGASVSQFIRYGFMKGLPRFGYSVDPERECSRFEQCGDALVEARRFHSSESVNGASLLGSGRGQAAGGKNFRRPVFQHRPSGRRRLVPIGLGALPRRPGLLGAEILVGVVHQGIKPALGSCRGELVSGDPFFQRFPNGKTVPLFPALALQEPRAPRLQGGAHDLWKLLCNFSNDPHPQNDQVPIRECRCAIRQLPPRHQECPLQCFLFSIAPNVENEVCGVSFRHPRLISGGGRLDWWSKLFYCTNSSASAEERDRLAHSRLPDVAARCRRDVRPGQQENVRRGYQ